MAEAREDWFTAVNTNPKEQPKFSVDEILRTARSFQLQVQFDVLVCTTNVAAEVRRICTQEYVEHLLV